MLTETLTTATYSDDELCFDQVPAELDFTGYGSYVAPAKEMPAPRRATRSKVANRKGADLA